MLLRVATAMVFTASLLTSCQREASIPCGTDSTENLELPQPESPNRHKQLDAMPGITERNDPKRSLEIAPPPRLAFIFQSEFPGRVTEIGKDSISIQVFSAAISGGWPEFGRLPDRSRRDGNTTWIPAPPNKTFNIYFAPLGPKPDLKCEVKPLNNGIDSGPGWEIAAIRADWTREQITITHPDGKVTVLRRADEPPRTFAVEWSYTVGVVPDDLWVPDTNRRFRALVPPSHSVAGLFQLAESRPTVRRNWDRQF